MQAEAENKFRQRLERFNAPGYTHLKMISRVLAFYLFAFALGILGFYFSDIPFGDTLNSRIIGHFTYLFGGCVKMSDYAETVFMCASLDIAHFAVVFASAFTMAALPICAAAAFLRGLSFGFSTGYICLAAAEKVIKIDHFGIAFLAYLVFGILASAAIIVFSAKAVIFSYDLKKGRGRRRKAVSFAVSSLSMFGALTIIALARCAFSAVYLL